MIQPSLSGVNISLRRALQRAFALAVVVVCVVLFWQRLAEMDLALVRQAISDVSMAQWALAGLATWVSFQAIGRYDGVWHRILGTGVPDQQACRAGRNAVALAQLVGFGAVTASFVRWRLIQSLSLWQATRLSLAVTITFVVNWAILALVALWWLGKTSGLPLSIYAIIGLVGVSLFAAEYARRRWAAHMTLGDGLTLLWWTAVDMAFAAFALFILIPDSVGVVLPVVIAAYTIALGVGLVSNAPGGVGAFDLTLLGLLPATGQEPLVAAIAAFRIVYYAIPALIAAINLARAGEPVAHCMTRAAQFGLARQTGTMRKIGGFTQLINSLPFVLMVKSATDQGLRSGNFRSGNLRSGKTIAQIKRYARKRGQIAALYNCSAFTAAVARRSGWHVRRTAMEAIINPMTWSSQGSQRQTLRRKLRQASQNGITIARATGPLPRADMVRIADQWARSHGGEMGLTMGRYCPSYVVDQQIFLIRKDHHLIGFVTFLTGQDGWVLDLVRYLNALPDGAMHAAISTAIAQAKSEGITRLSLASVPDPRFTPEIWHRRKAGLIQFKRNFGPVWVPRYHATPTRAGFWISGVVIAIAVFRPLANMPYQLRKFMQKALNTAQNSRFAIAVKGQS